MENPQAMPQEPAGTPRPSLITIAHIIYGLHSLGILIGVTSAVTIIGAFVFGIPSIIAVVMNYIYQSEVRGTFLESHFRWQIRTFWFAVLWVGLGVLLVVSIVGILIAWAVFLGAGIWVIYRIGRGWLTLQDRKPLQF